MAPSALTFRRGDAKNDGVINIADVLFIAQGLVGLRDTCFILKDVGTSPKR